MTQKIPIFIPISVFFLQYNSVQTLFLRNIEILSVPCLLLTYSSPRLQVLAHCLKARRRMQVDWIKQGQKNKLCQMGTLKVGLKLPFLGLFSMAHQSFRSKSFVQALPSSILRMQLCYVL